ncbi:MAG TPA: hypothetical protein VFK88_07275 [Gallionella sp.]|nr:hypothetical protein [Gallionella sp.]
MRPARIPILAAVSMVLTACAWLPPSPDEIAKVPKIRFGQQLPKDGNYVLFLPAGTPLPVSTLVDGNLFEHPSQATMHVFLKRNVYVYRQFASFDGKTWQSARNLIETHLELQVPKSDGSKAGQLHIKMDQK